MNPRVLSLVLVSVLLSACAQVALKFGAMYTNNAHVSVTTWPRTMANILLNPYAMTGLLLYAVSALLWLLVLAKTELSVAYAFVGLGFIVTMIAGAHFFNEQITAVRLIGTLLIALGVLLVASTSPAK